MLMEQKELKTVNDFQEAFAMLALECQKKFGAERISVFIDGSGVEITFK